MPQLIRPTETTTTIINKTKNGECQVKITLDLNINLNSDGVVASVSAGKSGQKQEDENVAWEIGDFSPKKKVKFGKEVKE
jgi:hypothetical protein